MIVKEIIDPKSIVVVGGSRNTSKPGGKILKNLKEGSYKADLFVVNNNDTDVQGLPTFPTIKELPDVEMAIIAISAQHALAVVEEIDRLNILQASLLAMKRAVEGLDVPPRFALIDGNKLPDLECPAIAVVGGDAIHKEISAASILAKVARDRDMIALADLFPQYGFERHKGYPTKAHLQALQLHGVTDQHRRSFSPVRNLLEAE